MHGVWGNNGGVFISPSHGEIPWYSPAPDQGRGLQGSMFGYLCVVLPADLDIIGIPGGGLTSKGKQPREAAIELHVLILEGEGGDH